MIKKKKNKKKEKRRYRSRRNISLTFPPPYLILSNNTHEIQLLLNMSNKNEKKIRRGI